MSKRAKTFTREEILDMLTRMVALYMDSDQTTPESTGRLGAVHGIVLQELTDDKSFHQEYGERVLQTAIDLLLPSLKPERDSA